jgi:hypothetical protein
VDCRFEIEFWLRVRADHYKCRAAPMTQEKSEMSVVNLRPRVQSGDFDRFEEPLKRIYEWNCRMFGCLTFICS